jgi:hypothetical protein
MKARVYSSPAAFKRALEDRLKAASSSGADFAVAEAGPRHAVDREQLAEKRAGLKRVG